MKIPNLEAIRDWCIDKFQPKGNYLTGIPDEYVTQDEMEAYSQPIGDYATNTELQKYTLVDDAGNNIAVSVNPTTGIMTITLKNSKGVVLSEKTANLLLESVVVGVSYSAGVITFTLQNGTSFDVDITDIVSGLVNNTFTIAGIDMQDDITAAELKTALDLDKVDNVSTNDQKPTFIQSTTRTNIESGETISTILGKIKKVFADLKLIAFSADYNDLSNTPEIPPAVSVKGNAEAFYRTGEVNITPGNIGLGNVENKSGETIRSEMTKEEVVTALGYIPANKTVPGDDMQGATEVNPGVRGLVPAPPAGSPDRYLGSDASWHVLPDTTYPEATELTSGLMSSTDKRKLEGIDSGANKTIVDSALSDTSLNPVQNKAVTDAIKNVFDQDGNISDTD